MTDFHEIWYLSIFRKTVKIQVSLQWDKNNGYFTWRFRCIFIIFRSILQEWKMFQANAVEKIKTHVFSNFFFENRAVYEIVWKNIVERGRPQMTWSMCVACLTPKATATHRVCYTHCFSTAAMVAQLRFIVTFIRTLSILLWQNVCLLRGTDWMPRVPSMLRLAVCSNATRRVSLLDCR
jgi:hypothetical protein